MTDFPSRLRAQLAARIPATRMEWEARPAAVLVPLYADQNEWHVLLTLRTNDLASHRGQVAFPGGRVDPADRSPIETALRETEEEIGLPRDRVTVLGQLDELLTVTQYRITPIVGTFTWPWTFTPSPREIAAIFGVPLRWLADPANLKVQYREPLAPGPAVPVYHFYYGDYDIWGATARIIRNLLEVIEPLSAEKNRPEC
ncbi:MAG: CoA pyrophosphatase [Anaerolineales bacterium]|nr:CoA pyrophosphatase [Anaerolineales bacterium]